MFRRKSAAQLTYLTSLTAEFYSACSFKIADFFSSSCFQKPGCKVRKLLNFEIAMRFRNFSSSFTLHLHVFVTVYFSKSISQSVIYFVLLGQTSYSALLIYLCKFRYSRLVFLVLLVSTTLKSTLDTTLLRQISYSALLTYRISSAARNSSSDDSHCESLFCLASIILIP